MWATNTDPMSCQSAVRQPLGRLKSRRRVFDVCTSRGELGNRGGSHQTIFKQSHKMYTVQDSISVDTHTCDTGISSLKPPQLDTQPGSFICPWSSRQIHTPFYVGNAAWKPYLLLIFCRALIPSIAVVGIVQASENYSYLEVNVSVKLDYADVLSRPTVSYSPD